ncbi:hypothetical protein AYI69_g3080 [Smittium culicis]|uniref:ATP-dependent rRNA helicase SPB4-like C-terminal tail domain-containing protein n=1 Tax=Smittium culicis TaxID=133412 RepID=A0A1R1YKT1_9FUNG|nr:hypothetical protein AYI69_g3080 [Smittium culicis]
MPELQKANPDSFKNFDFDYDKIPYTDKLREKQRLAKLLILKEKNSAENSNKDKKSKKRKVESWSNKAEQKEKKQVRLEKKIKKRDAISKANSLADSENSIDGSSLSTGLGSVAVKTNDPEARKSEKLDQIIKEKSMGGAKSLLGLIRKQKPNRV